MSAEADLPGAAIERYQLSTQGFLPASETVIEWAETGTSLASPLVYELRSSPQAPLAATWKGCPILSEDDLAQAEFPYPPEADWQGT